MTNPASGDAAAFDAFVETMDLAEFNAARERAYRRNMAADTDAAVIKIEGQIEGLRQALADKRAEATEHRAALAELGA